MAEQARYLHNQALGGLELLQARFRQQHFSRHVHAGYCIGVIEQGAQRFYRSGANHIASSNCIILVNADQVHDGHRASEEGWAYQAIYPEAEHFALLQEASQGLPYFRESVVSDRWLAGQLRLLYRQLANHEQGLDLQERYLHTMLALLERHGGQRPAKTQPLAQPALLRVRDYIAAHSDESLSLAGLAELAGLSPFHLSRSFQQAFDLPPHAFQVQCRLQHARRLLLAGHSVAEAAASAGFSDQSHLHRHFKRWLGVAPGRFAATKQARG
ncbi:AraC family transcriptional regulator [Balneatrix alpica]|uniref:AraC family ligand binding domain-containing protein n=1 Tax=Balneatrix alpica TaxID=75684 RepID=A0ABV5ZAP7_9GAMM|nr:AraC family transcriptional regulator [Balneatrix alpica]